MAAVIGAVVFATSTITAIAGPGALGVLAGTVVLALVYAWLLAGRLKVPPVELPRLLASLPFAPGQIAPGRVHGEATVVVEGELAARGDPRRVTGGGAAGGHQRGDEHEAQRGHCSTGRGGAPGEQGEPGQRSRSLNAFTSSMAEAEAEAFSAGASASAMSMMGSVSSATTAT